MRKAKRGHNVTLYVRDKAVWDEAKVRADSFDDSMSAYVEHALRFFNMGGNPDGTEPCRTCEQIRKLLK